MYKDIKSPRLLLLARVFSQLSKHIIDAPIQYPSRIRKTPQKYGSVENICIKANAENSET